MHYEMTITRNGFAAKVIANVTAGNVGEGRRAIGVLAMAQVDGLPKFLTSKRLESHGTLVFD